MFAETLENIHPNDYSIKNHLSQGYKQEQFAREAMAEITSIYNKVYREYSAGTINGKDIAGIDRRIEILEKTNALMEKAYPELFPVYRDEFIPHAIKKTHDLSKSADIEEKNLKFKNIAKTLSAILPTNIDNIAIAGVFGAATAGFALWNGKSISKAQEIGTDDFLEVSGLASAGRASIAGVKKDYTEASLQALDAIGIPVNAFRDLKKSISNEIEFTGKLGSILPKTSADAENLAIYIKNPMAKQLINAHANLVSLREQIEIGSYGNDIYPKLTEAGRNFTRIIKESIKNQEAANQIIDAIEYGGKLQKATQQVKTEPHAQSSYIPNKIAKIDNGIRPT